MVSCVIHGERSSSATPIDAETVTWTGYLARPDIPWDEAKDKITVGSGTVAAHDAGAVRPESPYKSQFRQGAVLAPQMALFVREAPAGPLGAGAGRVSVSSNRSVYEPERWKQLPAITATVETRFVRPTYLGLTTLPFRTLEPRRTLLAISDDGVLEEAAVVDHPGLKSWWDQAEKAWAENKSSPTQGRCWTASISTGNCRAAAARSGQSGLHQDREQTRRSGRGDSRAIIDFSLYWTAVATESEASYLCAILNSGTVLERVKPLQSPGLVRSPALR